VASRVIDGLRAKEERTKVAIAESAEKEIDGFDSED